MKNIMVIDDDPDVIDLVKKRLEANQFKVDTACSDDEAYRKLRKKNKPSLIILDVMMSDEMGYVICSNLKRDRKFADIPLLVLSTENLYAMPKKAARLGADAYLPKPFSAYTLLKQVQSLAV